jgi:hypothetical protein
MTIKKLALKNGFKTERLLKTELWFTNLHDDVNF